MNIFWLLRAGGPFFGKWWVVVHVLAGGGRWQIYFGQCWVEVGGGGYILAGDGWWWVAVDIFWLVVGSGGQWLIYSGRWWVVVDGGIVQSNPKEFTNSCSVSQLQMLNMFKVM